MSSQKSNRVAKNTGFMFIRMLVTMAVGLFTSREVLRILGVEDFGTYNLVGTIVVMFAFFQIALTNATSRYITFDLGAGNKDNLQRTFSMSINSQLILAVIIVLLSEIVGPWMIEYKLMIPSERLNAAHVVFQLSLLGFFVSLIRTPYNSLIIAHEKMDFYAYISIVEVLFKLVIVYMLSVIAYDKLIVYAVLLVCVSLVISLWMYVYCKHHFDECDYVRIWDADLFRKLTNYSGLSLLVNLCDVAVLQSISIFLNIFSGVIANAALGVANQVNTHLNQFLGNFSQSYGPQIIKSYAAKDYDYFMKLIFSTSKLSFFLLFGVAFPIVLNIEYILRIWLVTPPPLAGSFLRVIVCYYLIDSFSQPLWTSVHATGNLKVHQLLMGGIKILNIPISYTLLKIGYPPIIILIVWAFLNMVCAIVRIWWLRYLIGLNVRDYLRKTMWPIVYVTFLSILVPFMIKYNVQNEILCLILSSILFWGVFSLVIYLMALNTSEKKLINSLLLKIVQRIK